MSNVSVIASEAGPIDLSRNLAIKHLLASPKFTVEWDRWKNDSPAAADAHALQKLGLLKCDNETLRFTLDVIKMKAMEVMKEIIL